LLGAWIPVGQGTVKISLNRANLSGRVGTVSIDANDSQQLALGYVYDLSKRSALYTTVSVIKNKGAATYAVPGGASGMTGGGTSRGLEGGLRHNF
jgi:predicted porin